jgi:hypothetical protein
MLERKGGDPRSDLSESPIHDYDRSWLGSEAQGAASVTAGLFAANDQAVIPTEIKTCGREI